MEPSPKPQFDFVGLQLLLRCLSLMKYHSWELDGFPDSPWAKTNPLNDVGSRIMSHEDSPRRSAK